MEFEGWIQLCWVYKNKNVTKLQEERTVRRMYALVDHTCLAFAGILTSYCTTICCLASILGDFMKIEYMKIIE